VLEALLEAEEAKIEERMETSILGGLTALAKKQSIRASKEVRNIYEQALDVCVKKSQKDLWSWVQKAKARSLSDALGLGVLIPESLKSEAMVKPDLKALLEEEQKVIDTLKDADTDARLILRGELRVIHKRMQEHPPLKAILDLRVGNPISLGRLNELVSTYQSGKFSERIVFVDWLFASGDIYLCVTIGEQVPQIHKCTIRQVEVENWKKAWNTQNWQDIDEDESGFCLRELDPLIEPIVRMSNRDDLLVCAVTGVLHSIPIHALWIEQAPLIDRNPIVYCASMTTFAQCWQRVEGQQQFVDKKTVMVVYEKNAHTGFNLEEQNSAYKAAAELGSSLEAQVFVGNGGIRQNFVSALQSSRLFHFHGHCLLVEAVLTEQSIVLADGIFSVREVFEIKLNAPHITVIACESASQAIAAGDEPLGLVTALLCAGAASIVGNLWSIPSSTGRAFSEHFYAAMRTETSSEVVNLAVTLRNAVKKLRRNPRTRHPYYWASFVLHGAPFLRSSKGHS
jgi:CHAT domain-containing protein